MLNRKGEILEFIRKGKKVRTKDIWMKFGYTGATLVAHRTLIREKTIIEKAFDCGTCKYWEVKK